MKKLILSTLLILLASPYAKAEEKKDTTKLPKMLEKNINAFTRKSEYADKKLSLGGYFDTEYNIPFGKDIFFDNHHLVLEASYLYNDRLFFNTEIEFEHGGIVDNTDKAGEAKIEQAYLDFKLVDWLTFRSGVFLMPLGRVNTYHDSDIRQTTGRPLFNQLIVPTTWSEPGLGFYGSVTPNDDLEVNYDFYITQGITDDIDDEKGLKEAKPFLFEDNNNNKALSGRVGVSPFVGLEFGLSGMYCKYDYKNSRYVGLGVADFKYNIGAFELLGEGGMAFLDTADVRDFDGKPLSILKGPMNGYYLEARYKFFPEFLKMSFLGDDFDKPIITTFLRADQVDPDMSLLNPFDRTQFTVGFNYRPVTNVAFKFEYQHNLNNEAIIKNDSSKQVLPNQFLASVAAGF